jgi:hypothetical protein
MPNAQASSVRQVIANSALKTANLHFDAQTPLVPVNWIQSGGFTIFAAVTPRNIRGNEISQKQREWEAKAAELREKLLAAAGKTNDQAIRDEGSEAATEAKAEKDA